VGLSGARADRDGGRTGTAEPIRVLALRLELHAIHGGLEIAAGNALSREHPHDSLEQTRLAGAAVARDGDGKRR
jgi:hypothetical protein